ncbi:uncharacterized protein LOC133199515 [Saccostrea echinata]|uniref:uncharacterized protein LOC133199515 n=1 Tax=Saccostrea echinata TaxID=191078 RepID=UPI002A7ED77C|nr:uncharacterized protein LOC133199515 [Saccostrea echinata]
MGTLRDLQLALRNKIEELNQRDKLIDELEAELDEKDQLIEKLKMELEKCKAVLNSAVVKPTQENGTLYKERNKRCAISAEPSQYGVNVRTPLKRVDKPES